MTTDLEKQNNEAVQTSEKEEIGVTPLSPLAASILSRLEKEHVAVTPRWQFLVTEYGVWALWFVSVLVGAVAFSVMLFFMTHAGFSLYEATHETMFDFVMDVMPLAWIVVFVAMALFAHFNLRHTKHGYRYKVWQVLASSIVGSFLGGIVLHMIGMSFLIDDFMAKQVPMFKGLQSIETRMWQKPGEGRLIGVFGGTTERDDVVLFTDKNGVSWYLNTAELNPRDLDNLFDGSQVRVLGVPSSTQPTYFQGCGVFPLQLESGESLSKIRKERELFLRRMKEHPMKISDTFKKSGVPLTMSKSLCGGHATVLRIKSELAPQ